ncbi:MAG TPA: J domain-containing protein [Chloroflexota bacterium]|nr:J domain-containing protein [Chloroflexota bacterium]
MILKDLYLILQANPDMTQAALTETYRRLAKRAHPDMGGDHEGMASANLAWRILGDPVKRLAYDTWRSARPGESLSDVEGRFIQGALRQLGGPPSPARHKAALLATASAWDVLVEVIQDPSLQVAAARNRDMTRRLAQTVDASDHAQRLAGPPISEGASAQLRRSMVVPSVETLLALDFVESLWQAPGNWEVVVPEIVLAAVLDAARSRQPRIAARALEVVHTLHHVERSGGNIGTHTLVCRWPGAEPCTIQTFTDAVEGLQRSMPTGTTLLAVIADPCARERAQRRALPVCTPGEWARVAGLDRLASLLPLPNTPRLPDRFRRFIVSSGYTGVTLLAAAVSILAWRLPLAGTAPYWSFVPLFAACLALELCGCAAIGRLTHSRSGLALSLALDSVSQRDAGLFWVGTAFWAASLVSGCLSLVHYSQLLGLMALSPP